MGRKNMRSATIIAIVLLFSGAAQARPHPIRWIKTNKEFATNALLTGAAIYADMGSSIAAEKACRTCVETANLLPAHPSQLQYAGVATLYAGGIITFDRLVWHFAKKYDPPSRHLIWAPTVLIDVDEAFNIPGNVDIATRRAAMPRASYNTYRWQPRFQPTALRPQK